MVFFIIGTSVFALSAIMFMIALGLWTYADAKVKSNDSPALWTLIVLLAGFAGLIIYLVVGRQKTEKSPGKFKKFLIVSIACFGLSIPIYVLSIVRFIMELPVL